MPSNRHYVLMSRPTGPLRDDNLEIRTADVRAPGEGEIQLQNTWLSIDPTLRIWMSDVPQYMPPIELGDPIRCLGSGLVQQSKHPDFKPGDRVMGLVGWQTHPTLVPEQNFISPLPEEVSDEHGLSVLSLTTGLTAYFGFVEITNPQPGDNVVVTGAAGAVGSLVGQIAKIYGCKVVGIAGGPEKCKYVVHELGFDGCIDYRNEDVGAALDRHFPDGIDIDFENVAGALLDEILLRMKNEGRISLCGLVATYNQLGEKIPGPYNFAQILMKRLRIQGFIVSDYASQVPEVLPKLGEWAATGKLKQRLYPKQGFEGLPDALRELVGGSSKNIGKMLLKLED